MAFKGLYFPLFHQLLNRKVIFLNLLSPSFHQSQKFVSELLIISPFKLLYQNIKTDYSIYKCIQLINNRIYIM